jgi:hypothetical protein
VKQIGIAGTRRCKNPSPQIHTQPACRRRWNAAVRTSFCVEQKAHSAIVIVSDEKRAQFIIARISDSALWVASAVDIFSGLAQPG